LLFYHSFLLKILAHACKMISINFFSSVKIYKANSLLYIQRTKNLKNWLAGRDQCDAYQHNFTGSLNQPFLIFLSAGYVKERKPNKKYEA